MSISILEEPTTQHTVIHDIESLHWVLLFGGYHFFDNDVVVLWGIFYAKGRRDHPNGPSIIVGGSLKRASLRSNQGEGFRALALRKLITKMGDRWYQYYDAECQFFSCKECPKDATQRAQIVKRVEALSEKQTKPGSLERLAFNYRKAQKLVSTLQPWTELMNQHLRDQRTDAWPLDAVPDMYPRYKKKDKRIEDCEDDIKSTTIFEAYQISARTAPEGLKTSGGCTFNSPKKRAHVENNDTIPSNSPSRPKKSRRIAHTTTPSKARRTSRAAAAHSAYGRPPDNGDHTSPPDSSSSPRVSPFTSPAAALGVRRSSRLAAPLVPSRTLPSKRTRRTLRRS